MEKKVNKQKTEHGMKCVNTEMTTQSSGWCRNDFQWLILTYCCRNVSVGRVIGIHIRRVMGGGEHSVVVDSESWTETTERNSDSHLYRHTTQDSERRTMGGTWCAGMRQRSDAELSAQWRCSKRTHTDSTHHAQVYTWSLYINVIISD